MSDELSTTGIDPPLETTGERGTSELHEHLGSARTGTARTERSRRTRAALVDAVRSDLRATGGFTATTVAEHAGCSAATFYSHFATKDDALASAFEIVLHDLTDLIEATVTSQRIETFGLAPMIEGWVDAQVDFFRGESLVFRAALSRLSDHRGIRHAYREAERVTLDHLLTQFSAAQHNRTVRPGNVEVLAEAFLVVSQGLNNPRVLRTDATALRDALVRPLLIILSPDPVSNT
jgi:AcrR family transcriptional regulator